MLFIDDDHSQFRALQKYRRTGAYRDSRVSPEKADPIMQPLIRRQVAMIDNEIIPKNAVETLEYQG